MRYALRIRAPRVVGTVALSVETLRAAQAMARAWLDAMKPNMGTEVIVVDVQTQQEVWKETK